MTEKTKSNSLQAKIGMVKPTNKPPKKQDKISSKKQMISARIPLEILDDLRLAKVTTHKGQTQEEIIEKAIIEYLKKG